MTVLTPAGLQQMYAVHARLAAYRTETGAGLADMCYR